MPNVRTYTVIFRGLAANDHPKTAVAECLKHYNTLLKDTRLEPNGIHLNAALTVCAKAGDLDALFVIADSINEGARAPTAQTYTIILNALRSKALDDIRPSTAEGSEWTKAQKDEHISTLLNKGKSLFAEVQNKWQAGKLAIDEPLVCAMGRILLMSPKKQERRQIFDLLESTMKIPNLLERPELGAERDESMKNISKFSDQPPAVRKPTDPCVPGNNTLSLILTALAYGREVTAGIKYWNIMVSHYGIVPDKDTWWRMLKMLRAVKASAHAANMLEIMPKDAVNEDAIQLAMETCIRDHLNPNAVQNSNRIFDIMLERLEVPDPYIMRLYLRTALVTHSSFRKVAQQEGEGKAEEGKRLYGEQILNALGALWEPYKQAYYHHWKTFNERRPERVAKNENNKAEVIALARAMVSAFDKLTNEKMLSEKQVNEIKPVAAKIHREIRAHFEETVVTDPKIRRKVDLKKPMEDEITAEEKQKFASDHPKDAFASQVGQEWTWMTYLPLEDKKTRRQRTREEADERAEKRKENKAKKEYYISNKLAEEGGKKADESGKADYPWESDSAAKRSYDPMTARKKRPAWSPDAPWAKTSPGDKRYKAKMFDPRKMHDDSYHRRPDALGGEAKPIMPKKMYYGDARELKPGNADFVSEGHGRGSRRTPTRRRVASKTPKKPTFEDAFRDARSEKAGKKSRSSF